MIDPSALSPEQRRLAADALCAQVRDWLMDPATSFEVSVERGMYVRANVTTGVDELRPNGTATLVLRINGGAHHTSGPAVVHVPGMVG